MNPVKARSLRVADFIPLAQKPKNSCYCSKHFWAYTKKDTSLEKISWDFTVKQGILDVFCIYSKQNLSPDPEKHKILGLGSNYF